MHSMDHIHMTWAVHLLHSLTTEVHNGCPRDVILGDLPQDLERADHTTRLVGLQQVDEQVQPPRVPDGQLACLLAEVKVQEGTECNDCGRLVPALQVLDELLDLPVLTRQVSVGLLEGVGHAGRGIVPERLICTHVHVHVHARTCT